MNKNAASSVFRILNILGGAAREPKMRSWRRKNAIGVFRQDMESGSQPIYFQVRPLTKAKRCAWSKNSRRVKVAASNGRELFHGRLYTCGRSGAVDYKREWIQKLLRETHHHNGVKTGSPLRVVARKKASRKTIAFVLYLLWTKYFGILGTTR